MLISREIPFQFLLFFVIYFASANSSAYRLFVHLSNNLCALFNLVLFHSILLEKSIFVGPKQTLLRTFADPFHLDHNKVFTYFATAHFQHSLLCNKLSYTKSFQTTSVTGWKLERCAYNTSKYLDGKMHGEGLGYLFECMLCESVAL